MEWKCRPLNNVVTCKCIMASTLELHLCEGRERACLHKQFALCVMQSFGANVVVILYISNHTIGPHTRKITRKSNLSAARPQVRQFGRRTRTFCLSLAASESERAGARRLHNACKSGALRHTAYIEKRVTSTAPRTYIHYHARMGRGCDSKNLAIVGLPAARPTATEANCASN
jgi:hypothetical protein